MLIVNHKGIASSPPSDGLRLKKPLLNVVAEVDHKEVSPPSKRGDDSADQTIRRPGVGHEARSGG
jgi:hypothetical protein